MFYFFLSVLFKNTHVFRIFHRSMFKKGRKLRKCFNQNTDGAI